jgi:SAM-dependent methyltransferase
MSVEKYLKMQKTQMESSSAKWSWSQRNWVVGQYDRQNAWKDYDTHLFPEGVGGVALEYGCGPGRNLIRYKDRFDRIDGTDIAAGNLAKAKDNLTRNNLPVSNLEVCDGKSIPFADESYDVVFCVICLQHICSFTVRDSIIKDTYRVLKEGGHFCFQMGHGGKLEGHPWYEYNEDQYDVQGTNGKHDVSVTDENDVIKHLTGIGFTEISTTVRDAIPGDNHKNWIWVQCKK